MEVKLSKNCCGIPEVLQQNLGIAIYIYIFLSVRATCPGLITGRSTSEGSVCTGTMIFVWSKQSSRSSPSQPTPNQALLLAWPCSEMGRKWFARFAQILFSYAKTYGTQVKTTKIFCLDLSLVEFPASTPCTPSTTSRYEKYCFIKC